MLHRLIACVLLALQGAALASDATRTNAPIVVVAHRANHENAQENSLEAIRAAIAVGADFVELDIRRTRDGRHVLMHDKTVKRMTGRPDDVNNLTFEQIRELKLAEASRPSIPASRVPTFEEALDEIGSSIGLYLDFKEGDPRFLAAELRKRGQVARTVVYLGPEQMAAWREAEPAIRFIISVPDSDLVPAKIAGFIKRYPGAILDGAFDEYSPELIAAAHRDGAKVWPDIQSPSENPAKWEKAVQMGVDGLQTDHPTKLIEYLKSIGRR